MTKVLVVDDHESMRESLERLFNESGDFCVVGGISCADHAVRMCGELSPDIVFMDVCTEGGASGLRATKEVRDAFPDIKVIVATVYKGNIIKNLIMDCQSYTKYRPNETTGGIFVSWRRKEELPTGA